MTNIRTNNHSLIINNPIKMANIRPNNQLSIINNHCESSTFVEDSLQIHPYLKKRTQFSKSQIERKPIYNKHLRPNGHLVTQDKTNPNEPNFSTPQTAEFTQFTINKLRTMNDELITIKPDFKGKNMLDERPRDWLWQYQKRNLKINRPANPKGKRVLTNYVCFDKFAKLVLFGVKFFEGKEI